MLKADGDLAAIVGARVYSAAPTNPTYPYALVTCTSQPFATDDSSGMQHTLRVQGFARENKIATVLAIRGRAFASLNRKEVNLALPDHDLVLVEQEGLFTYFPEPDGRTYQSIVEFKVLVN